MTWVLPNALENNDVATTAWYLPTSLSPYPPSRPELEDDEDEEGMMATVKYLTTLIDDLVQQGIPEKRIVLGGFSQGHAMSLPALREEAGLPKKINDEVEVFLARGTGDRLVPKRYHRLCFERLYELGVSEERTTVREYEGLGHSVSPAELRDMCAWLEQVVPQL
jgi:lysophospholipase-1